MKENLSIILLAGIILVAIIVMSVIMPFIEIIIIAINLTIGLAERAGRLMDRKSKEIIPSTLTTRRKIKEIKIPMMSNRIRRVKELTNKIR